MWEKKTHELLVMPCGGGVRDESTSSSQTEASWPTPHDAMTPVTDNPPAERGSVITSSCFVACACMCPVQARPWPFSLPRSLEDPRVLSADPTASSGPLIRPARAFPTSTYSPQAASGKDIPLHTHTPLPLTRPHTQSKNRAEAASSLPFPHGHKPLTNFALREKSGGRGLSYVERLTATACA